MEPIRLRLKLAKIATSKPGKDTLEPVVTLTLSGEWTTAMDQLSRFVDRDFKVDLALDGVSHLVPSKTRGDWKQPGLAVADAEDGL